MAALITHQWLHRQQSKALVLAIFEQIMHFSFSSIDREGMCHLCPRGGWLE